VIGLEIAFIILLLIANGVFAMSEIAVVSARKARLQERANRGDRRARAALELAIAPDRFLSTVQIGITLVGILAGAFGGATIAEHFGAQISRIPPLAPYGEAIALAVVVLAITYLSLVIGELVPKRLGLNNPEKIASIIARPMMLLSRFTAPVVHLLSASTALVLKILRARPPEEPPVTHEEIKVLIEQGREAGIFEETEKNLVAGVFRLDDLRVKALMTPRLEVEWLDIEDSPEEIRQRIAASHRSRFPVGRKSLDNVIGILRAKDLLAPAFSGEQLDLENSLVAPLFVPETTSVLQLLERFKRAHLHLAIVIDEYGALEGLITMHDVMEAIVGEMNASDGEASESWAAKREDGSWLLDGRLLIEEFLEIFPAAESLMRDRENYETLAGFIIAELGRIPSAADYFERGDLRFEVVDMDRNRIDKVLVSSATKHTVSRDEYE
jgi:putative hemolysin